MREENGVGEVKFMWVNFLWVFAEFKRKKNL